MDQRELADVGFSRQRRLIRAHAAHFIREVKPDSLSFGQGFSQLTILSLSQCLQGHLPIMPIGPQRDNSGLYLGSLGRLFRYVEIEIDRRKLRVRLADSLEEWLPARVVNEVDQ